MEHILAIIVSTSNLHATGIGKKHDDGMKSSSLTTPTGKESEARLSRKWFGVRASKSSGSLLAEVRGRAFNTCSTRHLVVFKGSGQRTRRKNGKHRCFLARAHKSLPCTSKVRKRRGLYFYLQELSVK